MALKINDNGTERNMTPAEETAFLSWVAQAEAEDEARQDAIEAKQTARQAVLDKLGLTADEAATLFS